MSSPQDHQTSQPDPHHPCPAPSHPAAPPVTIDLDRPGRGFAAMSREKQSAIASKGGKAAHQKGTAHEFTREEAAAAGRKGGRRVSQNREHMVEIGRKGGRRRAKNAEDKRAEMPKVNETTFSPIAGQSGASAVNRENEPPSMPERGPA